MASIVGDDEGANGGAGEGGGGIVPGEKGPARGLEAAEDGGGTHPPTGGGGDGSAEAEEEKATGEIEVEAKADDAPPMGEGGGSPGGEKAPGEPEAASAPEPASPRKKRAADESPLASSPRKKSKRKQKRNNERKEDGRSGVIPTMTQQKALTALAQQMDDANQQLYDLRKEHGQLLAKTKPQAALISNLREENESLTQQLKECKARLLESERLSKRAQTDVRTLQERLRKQTEKTKEEKGKCERIRKELRDDYKKSAQFNQRTKLQRPGDEDLPKNKSDQKWHQKYEKLKLFKERHGHSDCTKFVPGVEEDYPGLPTWVRKQREDFCRLKKGRKTNLTPLRMKYLNDLG